MEIIFKNFERNNNCLYKIICSIYWLNIKHFNSFQKFEEKKLNLFIYLVDLFFFLKKIIPFSLLNIFPNNIQSFLQGI